MQQFVVSGKRLPAYDQYSETPAAMLWCKRMQPQEFQEKVQAVLDKALPLLGLHGGGIELVKIENGEVYLRFLGACIGCAAANYTLEHGIKEMLMLEIEEVEDVLAVNDEPITHAAPGLSPVASRNA